MSDGGFRETSDTEALAGLVGMTNAGVRNLDEQIVEGSSSLQKQNENWDAKKILSQQIAAEQQQGGIAPPPPPSVPVQQSIPQMVQPPVQPLAPQQPVIVQAATPPEVKEQLDRIENKLDKFLEVTGDLTTLDKKLETFIERGLKNKVRQITLKLDGTGITK